MVWTNIAIANVVKESYFCIIMQNKGKSGYICKRKAGQR